MSKLLPCPHCGEPSELYLCVREVGAIGNVGKPYAIDCLGCGYDFQPREGFDVVELWNRRVPRWSRADALASALRQLVRVLPRLRVPGENAPISQFETYQRQREASDIAKALLQGAEDSQ